MNYDSAHSHTHNKMKKIIKRKELLQFGEEVTGYKGPVLNEREIRAAAGILFLVMFISLVFILFKQEFLLIKYVILVFFTDFIIRVLINPRFSPTLILGRLIVGGQIPEYVGAPQKKFAWTIGLVLSGLMFFLLVILNSYSIITGFTCLVCLVFLFFETAFGICLGCLLFRIFYKDETRHCAGETCEQSKKHVVQKISGGQFLSLLSFTFLILLVSFFLNSYFRDKPKNLWQVIKGKEVANYFVLRQLQYPW